MDKEIVNLLIYYLSLPCYIEVLKEYQRRIAQNYYATHSLVGTAVLDKESNDYQRAISVECSAIDIITAERANEYHRKRLEKRYSLLLEEFTTEELERLRSDLYADLDLFQRAYEWIQEIEYYLDSHYRVQEVERLELIERPTEQQIMALDDAEAELFEMFGV
ncbi:MAG: hypothetical protein Q4A10_06735 [Aerococcaceae bacterium]|nr:hypothetical protein [Aerococcaceae bacterium]